MRIKSLFIALMLIIVGCATPGYKPIPAEPLSKSKDTKGIGEEAMSIQAFHLFDDAAYSKMQTAIKANKENKAKAASDVRNLLCEGVKPRVRSPEVSVTLVLPKGSSGDSIEKIAQNQKELVKLARMYLKNWLIEESSRPDLQQENFNTDFTNFKANVMDTGYERRLANNRIAVLIPFLSAQNPSDTIKYYSDLRATPTLPPMQLEPQQWFPSRHFIAVAYQRERKIILSVKAADFLKVAYGHLNYGTESTNEILKSLQLKQDTMIQYITDDESHNMRNHALYSPSTSAWKLENGTIARPLQMAAIDDIGFLREHFAWRLTSDIVEQFFKVERSDQRRFGIDDGKFSPELALENNQEIWKAVLASQTDITEVATDGKGINFSVKPDFVGMFCHYSIEISALKGE